MEPLLLFAGEQQRLRVNVTHERLVRVQPHCRPLLTLAQRRRRRGRQERYQLEMRDGTRRMRYDRRFGLRERGGGGDIVRVRSAILCKSCKCHENRGRDATPGERALATAPRGHRTYRDGVPFTASRHRDPERESEQDRGKERVGRRLEAEVKHLMDRERREPGKQPGIERLLPHRQTQDRVLKFSDDGKREPYEQRESRDSGLGG